MRDSSPMMSAVCQGEMRGYLGISEREDLTLDLWIEIIEETRYLR